MQVRCGQLQCDAAQIGRVGGSGVLSCCSLRGFLGCGGRGLWLEGCCGSTLAEISERDGSNRPVCGAVILMGKYCQAVSASVDDGGVIGVLVSVWSEHRWNGAVSVVGVRTSWWVAAMWSKRVVAGRLLQVRVVEA
eukprot:1757477-Rhodomonas_salina.1